MTSVTRRLLAGVTATAGAAGPLTGRPMCSAGTDRRAGVAFGCPGYQLKRTDRAAAFDAQPL